MTQINEPEYNVFNSRKNRKSKVECILVSVIIFHPESFHCSRRFFSRDVSVALVIDFTQFSQHNEFSFISSIISFHFPTEIFF